MPYIQKIRTQKQTVPGEMNDTILPTDLLCVVPD